MIAEKTKDVTISGRRYQLAKMTPETGCLIHSLLVYVGLKYAEGKVENADAIAASVPPPSDDPVARAEGITRMLWLMAPATLPEASYRSIQKYALAACSFYLKPDMPPSPVKMADGVRWADAELADDGPGMQELVTQSIIFSISPFFALGLATAQSAPTATS